MPSFYFKNRRNLKLKSKDIAVRAAEIISSKKGENIKVLNIGPLSSVADYIVLASCTNERQVGAIVKYVEEGLFEVGEKPIGVEGKSGSEVNWVLMDYGDVVVHVFHKEARAFYDMDGLWADAEEVELNLDEEAVEGAGA